MNPVSLKLGQRNSVSSVAEHVAQDESRGAAGSPGRLARVSRPLSNLKLSSNSAQPAETNKLD
jgi:hypothetical protein